MIKLIRNNQKKFIAGTGIILMVTFVVGYGGTPRNGREGPVDHEVGRVGGKAVMASEVGGALREMRAVEQYCRQPDPRHIGDRSASLLEAALGSDAAANHLMRQPELFVLLRREALAAGVTPNPTQAQGEMDEYLGGTATDGAPVEPPSTDSDTYALIRDGVTDLLTVANHFARVTSALKPSRPAVDRTMASRGQSIQLTLVPVPADRFNTQLPLPTPQQMDDQFKRFADVARDAPTASNPFGFGYRVPRLARLQSLRLSRDAVEKAVIATKSDYDWEVDARKLYHAHPEQFATAPPTTRPTDVPGPAVTPPFEKVRDDALRSIRDPLVQALQDQVQQSLTATLARDFQAYQAAPPDGVPQTPAGPAYDGPGYLRAVAAQAEAQFHVHVDAGGTDPLSPEQMTTLPHLGTAYAALASSTADASLPGYVSERVTAYLTAGDPKPRAAEVELLRPSPVFTEAAGDAIDIVRLSDVKPSHPAADLDAVRAAVEADVNTAAAYGLAKAQADGLVTAAATGTLQSAAAAARITPIATQPLSIQDVAIDGLVPPLGDATHDFLTQAFGLLDTFDPVRNPHPVKVIELPAQRRLIVAQLTFVNARWTPNDYYAFRVGAADVLRREQTTAANLSWFRPEAVLQRTGYKPAASSSGS